ncbi:MAG: AsmA-like C-terminal region-containing protein, partial [Crocinitomicaceae bacterium]
MKKVLRVLRKIFFWIFFVSLFIVTTLTVLLHIYEDDIKQYAIDELNDHLKTKVDVQDIELSIFHDFPNASIEFKKVFIPDAFPEIESTDTLFYAEKMFFNFNVRDIFYGDYHIKRISAHHGQLALKTSADGQTNYDIIKEEDSTSSNDNFELALELVELENMDFHYKNLASSQFYDIKVKSALTNAEFTSEQYNLVSEADLEIQRLKSNSFTLVRNQKADVQLEMDINNLSRTYTFKKGDLMIEKMPFHITGFIDSSSLDLKVAGDNIQLQDLANSLVDESVKDVKTYQGEGTINFVSRISGPISRTKMPSIVADFDIKNGALIEPESKLEIDQVSFKGHYQNEQSNRQEELQMKEVSMKMLSSYFKGEATITDFKEPVMKTKMDGDLNLARFHQFFKFEKIEKLAGNVNFHLDAIVKFFDPEFRKERFEVLESDGTFALKDVLYKGINDDITYQKIGGEIVLIDKDAAAKQLSIATERSDILLNGAMKNLMPYIDGTGSLGLIASIESNNLDLNEFMVKSDQAADGPLTVFELPDNLNLNIDLDVGNLKWTSHEFKEVSSKVLMSNRTVELNDLQFKSTEGSANGNITFKNLLEDGNIFDGRLTFSGVNMKLLFTEWNNFDQKSITADHITGKANGTIDFLLFFNPYFSLVEDKLYTKCDLKLSQGELNELETMRSITDYMRSNKGLKLLLNKHIDQFEDKLMHLKFSDIQNEITIQDRKVNIPKMHIASNALDIDLFGWHTFDNQIEYHFSFRFRELKSKVEDTEFGVIEDDGLGIVIYLTMFGDLDNPEFELDNEERRKNIKEDLAQEKQDIKSILKSEFGFFKKDSTVQNMEESNKKEVQFIFYDDEEEEGQDSTQTE